MTIYTRDDSNKLNFDFDSTTPKVCTISVGARPRYHGIYGVAEFAGIGGGKEAYLSNISVWGMDEGQVLAALLNHLRKHYTPKDPCEDPCFGALIYNDPRDRLRPCEVGPLDEPIRCWFHGWCGTSERPKAVVEGPHGNIVLWRYDEIRFADIPGKENTCTS